MKRSFGSSSLRAISVAAAVAILTAGTARAGQEAVAVHGQLYHAVSLAPVANAIILVEGVNKEAKTDRSGRYSLSNVPPGRYHVVVAAPGFQTWESDVTVAAGQPLTLDIALAPQLHYTEVISVSPESKSQFESYQPTAVLEGQDLSKELGGTIGATLATQPGMALRSFGPGPSRPVIRGLDGDRVLILEDGQRTGDLSSQSGDHGVTVNPAAARRIEVVRGPATLLYGSSAIGGLVNVITDTIPSAPVRGVSGNVTLDLGSAANEAGGAGDITVGDGTWAVHAGGTGRRASDVSTPQGTVDNSQARSATSTVGLAWTGARGFFGGSYGYDDSKYGIPFVEEGETQITPRRHLVDVRTGVHDLDGPFTSVKGSVSVRRYRHDELDGDVVATSFKNDTAEFDVRATHRTLGRLSGTVGGWGLARSFSALGEEALSPPVDERSGAVFVYEEVGWPHVTAQVGGRLDHSSYTPEGGLPDRTFTDVSGSVGLVYHPPALGERVSFAASLASAARHPALEELYFFGAHAGNYSFEIGDPDLGSERALGFDLSLRWNAQRFSGEVTYFHNQIDGFIFRNPISEEEFLGRYPDEEVPEFPVIVFTARDSVLQGVEVHLDAQFGRYVFVDGGLDYVRGELADTGDPLPRMPPLRMRGSVRYQSSGFQAGAELIGVTTQDRVYGTETPTAGYGLLKLFAACSLAAGRAVHTITGRLDNATNELYRNHLSFIKDLAPEMGRNFKLLYGVSF